MPYAWWRRPKVVQRTADVVLVLLCLGLTALAVKTPWSPLPRWVIAVAGTVGSAAVVWPRRRWPHLAAAAGASALAFGGNAVPWLVGLSAAAFYSPPRRSWLGAAIAFGGFLAWSWIDAGRPTAPVLVAGAVCVALVLATSRYLATRQALVAALRSRADHAAAEQALREEQARTAERTRIAREMHDILAHKISLIALHAGALELHAGDDARLREGTGLIRQTARQALQELREVLSMLRVEKAGSAEPTADLAELVRASVEAGQVVELHDDAGELPPGTARVVYRVVQEGLTNAHKHGAGGRTTVAVRDAEADRVTVTVRNELGAKPLVGLPSAGAGLIGLAERMRLVGGRMHSGETIHDGVRVWELTATLPRLGEPAGQEPDRVDAS